MKTLKHIDVNEPMHVCVLSRNNRDNGVKLNTLKRPS